MANSKASKKANRQSTARRAINKSKMSRIKTEKKKFLNAASSNAPEAEKLFKSTQSLLAKAAKTGLVHWKKASRLVSRMSLKLKKDK